MKWGKFAIFCVIMVGAFTTNAFAKDKTIDSYANFLVKKSLSLLSNPNFDEVHKVRVAENILRDNLDVHWMAKFSLGRNRKQLSSQQVQKFTDIYAQFMIKNYSGSISFYNGERISIASVNKTEFGDYVVKTTIAKPSSHDVIKIDFMVKEAPDSNMGFLVFDIITEGISIITVQRTEFNSVIDHKGFEFLENYLKQKTIK